MLGVGWFGPNAIPKLVTSITAPTFSGTVIKVVDGNVNRMALRCEKDALG